MKPVRSLREQLERLDQAGRLQHIRRSADPRYEIAAVAKFFDRGPALLFKDVIGNSMPVVCGTDSSRESIALSLGCRVSELTERYLEAMMSPLPPTILGGEEATQVPIKQVIRLGDEVDLTTQLPVPTYHSEDGGPYITSGVAFAEDQEGDIRNLSYHRMQVWGPRETGFVMAHRHLWRMQQKAERMGRPFPVAVVIGLNTAARLAAGTSGSVVPLGFDELSLAGALDGEPVALVDCETIPVRVPANAEIVIEGEILPAELRPEGPFAEFDGTYGSTEARTFRVTALTHRHDAIFQSLRSGAMEQLNLMGLTNEAVMLKSIRGTLPNVQQIHVTSGGLRKFHAVVSIVKQHEGDGKDAIIATFASHRDLKHVVIVDHDINPHDLPAVEGAIATRFQADRDLIVIDGGRGNPADKSSRIEEKSAGGVTARMGIDATAPLGLSSSESRLATVPGEEEITPQEWLE